ncbi:MAG: hypothetical protein QM756_28915 [Polyangiaceae bacterium]
MSRLADAPPVRAFEPHEIALSTTGSAAVVTAFLALLVFAGQNRAVVKAVEAPAEKLVPMQVRPVLDDLPLLKLGGKKRAKLPDMWKKNAPVQRFETSSAPSTKAAKTPDAIPDSPLAKPDAAAPPPPDADVAKQVDQTLLDAGDKTPTVEGEGSPDGVKEGTETDPLKARAVSAYRAKLISWFDVRFRPPESGIPCAELKKLGSSVSVQVSGDRRVGAYSVSSPSGNSVFDERVRTTLDRVVGEELPPPPPLYPDILSSTLSFRLSGSKAQCDDKPAPSNPAPPANPAPEGPHPRRLLRPRSRASRARAAGFGLALSALLAVHSASAQAPAAAPRADESALGEMLVTGTTQERLPRIAVLPSLSPDLEDVIVRGVVRRDIELTGLFDVIPDSKAPVGLYGFDDSIDIDAWRALGAEAIVKVAARADNAPGKIQVLGVAYFLNVGKEPVYQKKIVVSKNDARVTAHRVTDALLGALTGRPGGFASELTFSARWAKNRRIFRVDADGNGLTPLTEPNDHAIAPAWGPNALHLLLAEPKLRALRALFVGRWHQQANRQHPLQDIALRRRLRQGLRAHGARRQQRERRERHLRRLARWRQHAARVEHRLGHAPDLQPIGKARVGWW